MAKYKRFNSRYRRGVWGRAANRINQQRFPNYIVPFTRQRNKLPDIQSDTGVIKYIRLAASISLTAGGTLYFALPVNNIEVVSDYNNITANLCEAVKILSMKLAVYRIPNADNLSTVGVAFTNVYHEALPGTLSITSAIKRLEVKAWELSPSTRQSMIKEKWVMNVTDAGENQFYNSQGTSGGRLIPYELGGISFLVEGSAADANKEFAYYIITWKYMLRGVRSG